MKRIMMICSFCMSFWCFVFASSGFAAEFHEVGPLPSEYEFTFRGSGFSYHNIYHAVSKFMALSGDGSTVVSSGYNPFIEPYSWTVKNGKKWLGFSEGVQEGLPQSFATAVSYNGSIIAGRIRINKIPLWWGPIQTGYYVDQVKGFVWQNNTFTGLPWIPNQDHQALAYDISDNGSVVVGDSWDGRIDFDGDTNPWHRAVKWDYNISDLGTDGEDDSIAYAVSGDGSVIVGIVGDVDDWWEPAVKKGGAGWQRLHMLSSATCNVRCNMAVGVSSDGAKAVGHLYDGTKSAPALWDTTTRLSFFLSQLPGKNENGTAYDVSGLAVDTSFSSGKGYIAGGNLGGQAVLWKVDQIAQSSTVERVDTLLTSLQLGNQIKGWNLSSVRQVSDDGKTIAGIGINPNGMRYIWYANLDAPPPANDDCEDAQNISITVNDTKKQQVQGTTKNATHDVYQGCSSGKRLSVWYRFTAPAEGFLALDLCGSQTLVDPALSVFSSCWGLEWGCSSGCNGIPCTEPCLLGDDLVKVEQGEDYYVMVSSKDGVPGADFDLNYQFLPINDDCTEAFFLDVPSEIPGQTWLATLDSPPTCQDINATAPGVWYKVVGNGNLLTASTCDVTTDFDTKISVYCSGCSTPTCVAANNDDGSCGQKSSVTWCSGSGMVYYVFVHGYESDTGNFNLKITDNGTSCVYSINCHPVNEDCQEAIPLSKGTIMVDNSGTNPTGVVSSTCGSGGYHNIWSAYTTECDGDVTIDTVQSLGTLADTILSVYESCDGAELYCNDDYDISLYGNRSAIILSSPGNRNLLIRASSYYAYDTGTFPLRVTEVPDPLDIVPWSLPVANQYGEYSYQLPVSGGCPFWFDGERGLYYISVDNLPPGMNIDRGGMLWGIPTASGSYDFTVSVGDKDLSTPGDSATYTLLIKAANDKCEDATYITEGFYLFGNQDMDTDGPNEPGCSFTDDNVYSDVWFGYESSCTGIARVDLCDSSFNTKVAIYEDNCPHGSSAVYCNDDSCNDKSEIEFPVEFARFYLIRIGGADNYAQGNGELLVTCFNDCNGNGISDLEDIENGFSLDCNQDGYPDDCPFHEYVCDDDNPCTDDSCSQNSCVFSSNDANSCEDGDICNGQARCESGFCIPGTPPEPGCCIFDEDHDGDVDGRDLAAFPASYQMADLIIFAEEYGRRDCLIP